MLTSSDSDIEIELPPCINIGTALKELGVLNTTTNHKISQRQVLKELHRRPTTTTIHFNSNYVSNVSFRVRPIHHSQIRYKPYTIIERHRTKSENNEDDEQTVKEAFKQLEETDYNNTSTNDLIQLKKAKSLESIVIENNSLLNNSSITNKNLIAMQEVEVVSNSIQNLKVDE